MDIQEAINLARRGQAVAFLGSGFSSGAMNQSNQLIPSTRELAKAMADKAGVSNSADIQVVAELFQEEFGETELRRLITDQFTAKSVKQWHKTIASIPWRRIYTTNFDDVFELAAEEGGQKVTPLTLNDAPDRQGSGVRLLVHLHGSVRPFTRNQGAESAFQLTSGSYFSSKFPSSPWSPAMRTDFLFARSIFFIGYSLSDFDIARMLFDDSEVIKKTFIICRDGTSEVEKRRLSKFGTVLPIGVEEFSGGLSRVDPATAIEHFDRFIAFREVTIPAVTEAPSQDSYVDMLTTGRFKAGAYAYTRSGIGYYCTPRHALGEIKKHDSARRILVHSGLGNGKTLFLQQLAQEYLTKGFKVFEFVRKTDSFPLEIAKIVRPGERVCLIFDNLFQNKDGISFAHANVGRDDIIVCSCRTLQYELNEEDVQSTIGADYLELDLNHLAAEEISHFNSAFSSYGLWGRDNHLPDHKKKLVLAERCNSEIRSIVLFAFSEGPVSQKIKNWTNAIEGAATEVRRFVLSSVILSLVHAEVSFLDLCDLLEIRPQEIKRALQENDAGDLVLSSDTRRIGVRSAILAEHLAARAFEPETVQKALTTLVRRLADWLPLGAWAREILRELLRFAVVGRLFDSSDRKDFIVDFYESIREIEFCRQNPQFWLQYAMARMDRAEYPLAEKLLGMAESRAVQMINYNTFQIDNQKAKFLLVSRARSDHYSDFQRAYLEAAKLIFRQAGGARKYGDPYPLRLIGPHEEFLGRRFSFLEQSSHATCNAILKEFSTRLARWPIDQRGNEYREWVNSLGRAKLAAGYSD